MLAVLSPPADAPRIECVGITPSDADSDVDYAAESPEPHTDCCGPNPHPWTERPERITLPRGSFTIRDTVSWYSRTDALHHVSAIDNGMRYGVYYSEWLDCGHPTEWRYSIRDWMGDLVSVPEPRPYHLPLVRAIRQYLTDGPEV